MFKKCTLIVPLLAFCAICLPGPRKASIDTAAVIITLNNLSNANQPVDSVFVVIDKFDLTGAGIVKKIFYPVNNRISLTIPKGKYYLDLICFGMHTKEHFGSIIKAKSKKNNSLLFKLKESGIYIQGMAYIPQEKFDPANLSVTRCSFNK